MDGERRTPIHLTTRELEDLAAACTSWINANPLIHGSRRLRLERLRDTLTDVAALASDLDPEPPQPQPEATETAEAKDLFTDPVWRQEFARLYGAPRRNTGRRNHG